MTLSEEVRFSLLIRSFAIPSNFDFDVSIPANSTVTITANVPSNYAWFKIGSKFGPVTNRALSWSIISDTVYDDTDLPISLALASESFRHTVSSIIFQQAVVKITNNDTISHDLDFLARGFLVRKEDVNKTIKLLSETSLDDKTIEKLADKIAEKIGKYLLPPLGIRR